MKTQILFKKIKNDHERLRDDEIIGHWQNNPQVGEQFVMYAKPKDPSASLRCVNTSNVVKIDPIDNGWALHTESGSLYHVTLIAA
jgi:hypothetical protein